MQADKEVVFIYRQTRELPLQAGRQGNFPLMQESYTERCPHNVVYRRRVSRDTRRLCTALDSEQNQQRYKQTYTQAVHGAHLRRASGALAGSLLDRRAGGRDVPRGGEGFARWSVP